MFRRNESVDGWQELRQSVCVAAKLLITALLLLLAASRPSSAQIFPERGFLPGVSYDSSSSDDVNLFSGNMIYRVPVYKFPPGPAGQSMEVDLVYNSFIYEPVQTELVQGNTIIVGAPFFPSTTGGGN